MWDNHILRFQISMHNIVIMHFFNPFTNLSDFLSSFLLRELFVSLHQRIERAFLHILDQHVKMFSVCKATINFHQLRMMQEHLNFDFLYELIHHMSDWILSDFFEPTDEACFLVNSNVELAKSAFALAIANIEIFDTRFFGSFNWSRFHYRPRLVKNVRVEIPRRVLVKCMSQFPTLCFLWGLRCESHLPCTIFLEFGTTHGCG